MPEKIIQMPNEVLTQLKLPPKGFEYSGEFRRPKKGERFLSIDLKWFPTAAQNRASNQEKVYPVHPGPRFILRKKPS